MTTHNLNLTCIDSSWKTHFNDCLAKVAPDYLAELEKSRWLPGPEKIFNAFSLPLSQVEYVLFGESPYPRAESANGYAFWDAAVTELWSPTGLSKRVNRATSMRHLLKMLLIAEGLLDPQHTDQQSIASIDKTRLVQTNTDFFSNLLNRGFLLLNATPVLQPSGAPQKDAKAWLPFIEQLLSLLLQQKPTVTFILFGKIANTIKELIPNHPHLLQTEHPYNISFIHNPAAIAFFKPLRLLLR
jgi:uracil-DNA glycosylase